MINPQPVAGTDEQYINRVTAANAPLDGTTQPMLIQVDPKYTFYKAARGTPHVSAFDGKAWNTKTNTQTKPNNTTNNTNNTNQPHIRFVMVPIMPVFQCTR